MTDKKTPTSSCCNAEIEMLGNFKFKGDIDEKGEHVYKLDSFDVKCADCGGTLEYEEAEGYASFE